MHIIAYVFGLVYYIAMPLTLLPPSAFNFDAMRSAWAFASQAGPGRQLLDSDASANATAADAAADTAAGGGAAGGVNATAAGLSLGFDTRVMDALHDRPEPEAWRLWAVSGAPLPLIWQRSAARDAGRGPVVVVQRSQSARSRASPSCAQPPASSSTPSSLLMSQWNSRDAGCGRMYSHRVCSCVTQAVWISCYVA